MAEGSSIDVACATISDGNVTFTAADAKVIKVEKIGAHLAKVTGLKVGETDLIVKLAATEYYKGADAKVKIIVKPTYSLKDAVVDGAKLKIGYVFNKKECVFAYEFDGDKKVFNLLSGNSTVPEGLEDDYEITMTYDGETTMTHKLVSKKDPTVVPFLLNLYVSDSYDRVFSVAQEMKSVQVNNYEMLPYVPESVTPVDILTPGLLPDNMAVGDKGVYPINIFPDNATNQVIKYTSSDPNVITIDAAGNFECVAAGTATIKAEATDGSGKFVEKEITVDLSEATVTTPPTAKTGIKAGENAAIINAGVATGGTMMYKVTTANTKPTTTDGFSATVPTAQSLAAGTYYVWYYVKADATHADSDIAGSVSVTIQSTAIALSAVTSADVNKIVTSDGYVYATTGDVPTGKTAAAKIAYVSSTGHGLALALADESGSADKTWIDAKTACSGHTPTVSGGTWKMATKDEWGNMITAAGNYYKLCQNFNLVSGMNPYYWSSTESGDKAYYLTTATGNWDTIGKTYNFRARAVLAF